MRPPHRWMAPVCLMLIALSLTPHVFPQAFRNGPSPIFLAVSIAFIASQILGLLYLYLTGRVRYTLFNWGFIALIPLYLIALYCEKHPLGDPSLDTPSVMILVVLLYIFWTIRKTPKGLLDYLKLLYLMAETFRAILFRYGSRYYELQRATYPGISLLLAVLIIVNMIDQRRLYRDEAGPASEMNGNENSSGSTV